MSRRTWMITVMCCMSAQVWSQLSISEFIRSAGSDHEVKTFDNQYSFLNKKTYRLPALRELELRFQNRELIDTRNEVALRISPANPWEMRATGRYFGEVQKSVLLERELALKEALLDRYYTVIEYVHYQALKNIALEGQESLKKQVSILETRSGSSYFDADDYAELKVDELDYEARFLEYDYELAEQFNRIERMYPKAHRQEISWGPDQVISVERIREVMDSLVAVSARSAVLAYQQQQINVAKSHYNLERSNINVGFGQIEYDFQRVGEQRTPFNFSFGITLPIVNPNKPDMARRRLKVIEAEHDLEEAEQETSVDIIILQDKLTRLIASYFRMRDRLAGLQESNFGQSLSTMKGGDPFLVVQFNERLRKLDVLLVKIRTNILTTYVEYLAYTDRLQQQPLINYFTPGLAQAGD